VEPIRLLSPAKVNLRLDILGRRSDGYHEVRTVLQKISLFDEVTISPAASGITVACPGGKWPQGPDNLAHQAARALFRRHPVRGGIEITIRKSIPAGAGLGGGSSNAATTLEGVTKLFRLPLSRDELIGIGASLGADVPFFLFSRTAFATGIGDQLEEIRCTPRFWLVLVHPGFPISTAWAYRHFQPLHKKEFVTPVPLRIDTFSQIVSLLSNDFEGTVFRKYPVLPQMKEELKESGAEGVLMSGSGSTVFGIFSEAAKAKKAFRRLSHLHPGKVFMAQNL
jgi:4-diphosphocytidyl-2-C-methyl-D-erythritol kinase